MCTAGSFNLSHKSLASPAIRQELNKIAQTAFYQEITSGRSQHAPQPTNSSDSRFDEDHLPAAGGDHDDSTSVSTRRVKKRTIKAQRRKGIESNDDGAVQIPVGKPEDDSMEGPTNVAGYDRLAIVDGEGSHVVPVAPRKSSHIRSKTNRFTDPAWLDNDVSTSEDESEDET